MRKLTPEGRYSHPLFQRGGTEAQQLAVGAGDRTQALSPHPHPHPHPAGFSIVRASSTVLSINTAQGPDQQISAIPLPTPIVLAIWGASVAPESKKTVTSHSKLLLRRNRSSPASGPAEGGGF